VIQLAGIAACSLDPYACNNDDQCRRDGEQGTCRAIGFCSYPDDDCPSGSRFSPNAGGDRAGTCVDEVAGSSTSGECETGPQCPESGEIAWSRGWSDTDVRAVALALDGDVLTVVGNATGGATGPWLVAVTTAGDDAFGPRVLAERAGMSARAAVGLPDTVAIVGTSVGDGVGGERAVITWVDGVGAIADEQVVDTLAPESFAAVARTGDGIAAVGRQGDDGFIRWVGSNITESRAAGLDFAGASGRDDGAIGVVGRETAGAVWQLLLPGGVLVAESRLDVDELRAIAFGPDGAFVVGGRRADRPFIARFDANGEPSWTRDLDGDTVAALAVDRETGDPFVAIASAGGGALLRVGAEDERWRLELTWDGAPVQPVALVVATDGDLFVSGTAETTTGAAAWLASVER
jgi:hypothetical protein